MSWRSATSVLLVLLAVALCVYDLIAAWRGGSAATISDVILTVSMQRPMVPFVVGVLCGHLFFPQDVRPPSP